MSFRSLVFAGFVLLLTAFYQSKQPSALTVTTGLTPRQRVKLAHVSVELEAAPGRYTGLTHATPTPRYTLSRGGAWLFCGLRSSFAMLIPSGHNRGDSSGAATKSITSWSNALDEPGRFDIEASNDQCGLFDVDAPSYDQCAPIDDAPNDTLCAPKETAVASPEGFKSNVPVYSRAEHSP